jgi:hypothetical protein
VIQNEKVTRPEPGDDFLTCPLCQGRDSIVVGTITADVMRRGKLITVFLGHRRACQACPNVFSTRKGMSYQHHRGAHPWMPQAVPVTREEDPDGREERPRAEAGENPEDARRAQRPPKPMFLEPPDV